MELLERYSELSEPGVWLGVGGDGGGVPRMPVTYTASVRELERLLRVMRDDRSEPLVRDGVLGPVSVRRLWWHVNAWWLAVDVVLVRPVRVPRSRRGRGSSGLRGLPVDVHGRPLPVRVVRRQPGASRALAELGVAWMAERWGLSHEPMLPRELLVAA